MILLFVLLTRENKFKIYSEKIDNSENFNQHLHSFMKLEMLDKN